MMRVCGNWNTHVLVGLPIRRLSGGGVISSVARAHKDLRVISKVKNDLEFDGKSKGLQRLKQPTAMPVGGLTSTHTNF